MSEQRNDTISTPPTTIPDTTLVKAGAALLIVNSHLEEFYPYRWLAGDGLVGNSLFFLLAGYGLARSEQVHSRKFRIWYQRRVVRIYPSLWAVLICFPLIIGGAWRDWTTAHYIIEFIWPTRFTFVQLIMPFYLIYFFILKLSWRWIYPALIAAGTVLYIPAYYRDVATLPVDGPLLLGSRSICVHAIAYFQIMLLGGWLGGKDGTGPNLSFSVKVMAVTGFAAAYLIAKLLMVTGHGARGYPLLHMLTFVLCLAMFCLFVAPDMIRRVHFIPGAWLLASFVGGLTLEIYLVHVFVASWFSTRSFDFPINLGLFWILTLLAAAILGTLRNVLQRLQLRYHFKYTV